MNKEQTILVIDDEAVVCESFDRILSGKGYRVDTQTKPKEGLAWAVSKDYDLVFLDLKMEEMDGIDLFYNIRGKKPDLPVIIVTGYPSVDTAVESIKLGVADYLMKPFTPEEIMKSLKRAIPEIKIHAKEEEKALDKKIDIEDWETSGEEIRFYESAWLQHGKDGSVRVGGQPSHLIDESIQRVKIPAINDTINRGLPLAEVSLSNNSKLVIPSPVTGKIVSVNYRLEINPSILEQPDFDNGWIAVIEPADLEKDLQFTTPRKVVLFSRTAAEYLERLIDLGCTVSAVTTVETALDALREAQGNVIIIDVNSLADKGPESVAKIKQEAPEANVIVIDAADSDLEEVYRRNRILYYGVKSMFNEEIPDILASAFTSINDHEVLESFQSSFLPQSISKMHITNKHGKKVTLLAFGDILYNNKGIGYVLVNKLLAKSYPLEVTRSSNPCFPGDPLGQQKIAKEKEKNDTIIILQSKDNNKIPGQISKEADTYVNSDGSINRLIHLSIQPDKSGEHETTVFNNVTTKAAAELILNEMAF